MLGFKRNMQPASAQASREIRQAALRMATGKLNENDKKIVCHQKELSSLYVAEWK